MKNTLREFFSAIPFGPRSFLLLYVIGFPVALLGHYSHVLDLHDWLALSPALVWKGQVWRLVSYAFLPSGVVDWAVSLFWLATLVSLLGRNWSARGFWGYCLLAALAGAAPIVLLKSEMERGVVGNAAILFGLLVAWDWLYRRERLILLGIGEISVRQAAILIAVINMLILLFCAGWFLTLAMICGGVGGWIYLILCGKLLIGKSIGPTRSERVARLEL